MNGIVLTIGIPVYNGGNDFKRLLTSINQQDFDRSVVQILVSDNSSSDSSVQIANEHSCEVLTSDKNYGADRNILKTIKHASGEYVWVIGHDDILLDGSINRVVDLIKNNNNVSSIFLNYSLLIDDVVIRERFVDIDDVELLESKDEILFKLGVAPNFISSLVHEREKFLDCIPEKYIGTFWLQTATWLEYADSGNVVAVGTPQVLNAGNSEGREANTSDIALKVLENLYVVYSSFCESKQQLTFIERIISRSLIRKIFNIRKRNLSLDKAKIEWIRSLNIPISSRIQISALTYSPMVLIRFINMMYKSSRWLRRLAWARI